MSHIRSHRKAWSALASAFTTVSMVIFLVLPLGGVALAAAPTIVGQNPNPGPGFGLDTISDNGPPSTDGTFHFVARVSDAGGLGAHITTVEARVDDGDADATVDFVVPMTRVGTTDTWEAFDDISARPASTRENDITGAPDAAVTFRVVDSSANEDTHGPLAVFFNDAAETVEVTSPVNGGSIRFFDRTGDGAPEAVIQGTISQNATGGAHDPVLFYSTSPATAEPPALTACGTATTTDNPGTAADTFEGVCELSGADTPSTVTMIGAAPTGFTGGPDHSGDVHRVATAIDQTLTTFDLTPAADTESFDICNTYTVQARDQNGQPIAGLNVDVHATGTAANDTQDNIQFANNRPVEGDASDPFRSPTGGSHTDSDGAAGPQGEDAAGCDKFDEADTLPDDNDDNTEVGAVGTALNQGNPNTQAEHDNPGGSDTKHIEGETQTNGNFRFSLDAEQAGNINILAWAEVLDEDDVFQTATEPSDTATKTFQAAAAATLDAEPETDINLVGEDHAIQATAADQNGNPIDGVIVHFRVSAGPDADENLDNDALTPLGYFGNCTSGDDSAGRCTVTLDGESGPEAGAQDNETGTDQIQTWFGSAANAPPTPEAAAGNPSGTTDTDRQDVVTKTFLSTAAVRCIDVEPNDDLDPTTDLHQITAHVTDQARTGADTVGVNDCPGNPLSGMPVDFEITDDVPDASLTPDTDADPNFERVFTNAQGQATVTLDNVGNVEGDNKVNATVPGASGGGGGAAYSLSSIPINFEDISGTGTNSGINCDDCVAGPFVLPFTFNYFDTPVSQIFISSNGFTTFNTEGDDGCCSGDTLPSASTPNGGVIAGYWNDLVTPSGQNRFQTLGTAPNRRFIVQFTNVGHCCTSPPFNTFQIKLFEGSNVIEVHLLSAGSDGSVGSAGIENSAGTVGVQAFRDTLSHDNQAFRFEQAISEEVSKNWATAGKATTIDCSPENAFNLLGSQHTATCTVTDAFGSPVQGANVDFQVVAGPHSDNDLDTNGGTPPGYFGEGNTNAAGQVSSSYTGTETTPNFGHDVIDGWLDAQPAAVDDDLDNGDTVQGDGGDADTVIEADEQTDAGDPSDFLDKQWSSSANLAGGDVELDMFPEGSGTDDTPPTAATPNTKKCNANLADFTDTVGSNAWNATHTGALNSVELVCVSAKDSQGQILFGATMNLASSGVGVITDADGPPPGTTSATAVIDGDGYAEFYIHSTQAGAQNVTATVTGMTDTDSGTKTWSGPTASEARNIDCEPETDVNAPNTDHEITCTVSDGFTNPVAGVTVAWTKTESGGATSAFTFQSTVTDANGQVRATINSPTEGQTQVTATMSAAATECDEAADEPDPEDVGKPAGNCSASVTKTWGQPPPPPPPGPGPPGAATLQLIPEGATHSGFQTFVLIANPSTTDTAHVTATFLTQNGPVSPTLARNLSIAPQSRRTLHVNALIGPGFDVGTKVIGDIPIVAEGSMHFAGSRANADMIASDKASSQWIMPEGVTQAGFTTFVQVANPDEQVATEVTVRFLTGSSGERPGANVVLPPGTRRTINVNSSCACPNEDVSTIISVVGPKPSVVAGVSVHRVFANDLGIGGSIGSTNTGDTWVVPEGATHSGWQTFVLVSNPNPSASTVNVTFLTSTGPVSPAPLTIPANARRTIQVNLPVAQGGCGCSDDVATVIDTTSGPPVAVEASIQKEDLSGFVIADSLGSAGADVSLASGTKWLSAEGHSGDGFTTFILIANPGATAASGTLTFLTPSGPVSGGTFSIVAGGRETIDVNVRCGAPCANNDVSTLVDATAGKVAVEMAIDWAQVGVGFSKGRSLGSRLVS